MEHMPDFDIARPSSIAEAVALRAEDPGAAFIAGGTDLVPNMRRGIARPEKVIDLGGIAEITAIAADGDGIAIGAGVTLETLIDYPDVQAAYPAVAEAAAAVAAHSHRGVGTVGGNLCLDTRCVYYNQSEWWRRANSYCLKSRGEICHVAPKGSHCFAAFSGDLAPGLLVFGAVAGLAGPAGERTIPLAAMYRDDGLDHLALEPGEMLVSVSLPAPPAGARSGYVKARVRGAIDFPLAGVAAAMVRDGDTVSDLRVALTGTNSMPIVLAGTDDLIGQPVTDAWLDGLVDLIPKQIQPMTSTFSPPGYRRRVTANMARSLVRRLFAG